MNEAGNTRSKSAALRTYDRTSTTDNTATVSHYGLNYDSIQAACITHTLLQTGGLESFLQDWRRADNSGSVKVIIAKLQN